MQTDEHGIYPLHAVGIMNKANPENAHKDTGQLLVTAVCMTG
jgi:hypothetical protein